MSDKTNTTWPPQPQVSMYAVGIDPYTPVSPDCGEITIYQQPKPPPDTLLLRIARGQIANEKKSKGRDTALEIIDAILEEAGR